uniref:RING-type E3 ubiquitin transferase n=1 Tax=Oncorhynchus tshawytscha TaxID=74940 RepID=A0AAZ3RF28_ONCTS
MGGKQSTAGRPRGAFPGVSTDDSAVPPSAHFGHYRPSGTMGLRSRSVSSVAGMGIEHSPAVPFGFYTPRGTDSDRAGGGSGTNAGHGNGYQETGGGHHTDGMLYLGSRGSLADTLPLHIAPRWFSAHSAQHSVYRGRGTHTHTVYTGLLREDFCCCDNHVACHCCFQDAHLLAPCYPHNILTHLFPQETEGQGGIEGERKRLG